MPPKAPAVPKRQAADQDGLPQRGGVFLRNVETGVIRIVNRASAEFSVLKGERTSDGRFPLWEQTGAHDADPENHASAEEVKERSKWGVTPLSDVTADGVGQSTSSAVVGSRVDAEAATAGES